MSSSHHSEALQARTMVEIAATVMVLRNCTVVIVLLIFPQELFSAQVQPDNHLSYKELGNSSPDTLLSKHRSGQKDFKVSKRDLASLHNTPFPINSQQYYTSTITTQTEQNIIKLRVHIQYQFTRGLSAQVLV